LWCADQTAWLGCCLARKRRVLWPVAAACVAMAMTAPAWAETLLVPSITIAERYDTNVFFIGVGENLTDFVTTTTPSLNIQHKGRVVEGTATATVMGEVYAKNPGLNYVGTSASANLNLNQVVGRIDRRASLILSDSFSYTPRPPGFLAPDTGSVVPPDFVRGMQALRANSITNVGTAAGSYGLTSSSNLLASYTNMYMRFGNFFAPSGATGQIIPGIQPGQSPFFTTRMSIITVGPEIKPTPRDTITASFQQMQMNFSGGGTDVAFETKGGLVGWKRNLTAQFTASGSVGLSILTPGNSLQYLANAALEWKHKNTTASVSYSRTIFPSFFLAAAPLISQIITAGGTHKLSEALTVTASTSYALNETIGGTVPVKFESYVASLGATYVVSRTVTATASYSHYLFIQGFVGQAFTFDRDVLMVSLRKEWH
jgi:hypothetical protein